MVINNVGIMLFTNGDKHQKKMLFVQEKSYKWNIPAGGKKPYETLFRAMKREFKEETNFNLPYIGKFVKLSNKLPPVGKYTYYDYPENKPYIRIYISQIKTDTSKKELPLKDFKKTDETINIDEINYKNLLDGNYNLRYKSTFKKMINLGILPKLNNHIKYL